MGLTQSASVPDGGTDGYHVHGVEENSPAQKAGLEPFFDFIISLGNTRLNQDNDMLKDLLKANVEKAVRMEVFSTKNMRLRELEVVPSNMWGGQGLLGASVRFCSFQGANENVWHVLNVETSSPAELAGLQAYSDFIVGADQVLQDSEDFFTLIEAHEGKSLKLLVYSMETDGCREVIVTPNGAWGGEGSLGCGIGYGYLHRIPAHPHSPKSMNISHTSSTEECNSEEPPAHRYTEVSLMTASGQSVSGDTPLPPPIQRVMDPGISSELEVMSSELSERLDLSVSSTDMTNTSVARTGGVDQMPDLGQKLDVEELEGNGEPLSVSAQQTSRSEEQHRDTPATDFTASVFLERSGPAKDVSALASPLTHLDPHALSSGLSADHSMLPVDPVFLKNSSISSAESFIPSVEISSLLIDPATVESSAPPSNSLPSSSTQ
ncbi:Golgi reassembly-stacking protein 1a [Electrophorus electricus]|uniref:PDZ GRASP-type domain-containing protein n=1 Tax=Electrophorus electricus TaxID=8005 RepID=A0AAY5EXK7_ELEEL|nr:Golgi reassembly-stacking protein 1a [Electrophorus electricus]